MAVHGAFPVVRTEVVALGVNLDGTACLRPPGVRACDERAVSQVKEWVEQRHWQAGPLEEVPQLCLGRGPYPVGYLGEHAAQQRGILNRPGFPFLLELPGCAAP